MRRTPVVDRSVNCVDVREARLRGTALTQEAAEHAEHCPVCCADAADGVATSAEGLDDLFSGIEKRIGRERGITALLRSRSTPARLFIGAVWIAVLVTWCAVSMPRTRFAPIPVERFVLVLTVLSVLGAVLLRAGLRPAQTPAPSDRTVLLGVAAGLLFPVATAFLPAGLHAFDHYVQYTKTQATIGCFVIGAVTGALVVLLLRALDRTAHGTRGSSLLAAVTGGVAGNLALELHCPVTAPSHILLGHATVGLVLVLVYGLARQPARA